MRAGVLDLCGWQRILVVLVFCEIAVTAASAQNFLTIYRSGTSGGSQPNSPLVEGLDGKLYGTFRTYVPGYEGSFFKIGVYGTFETLHQFCESGTTTCADGSDPGSPLLLAPNGQFYGVTNQGGSYINGVVFRATSAGTLKTLHNLCLQVKVCPGGGTSTTALALASDGSLYGANADGGSTGYGTVFKINSQGAFSVIYRFCSLSACADGANPNSLIVGTDGNLYGTTYSGGANRDYGTVFKLTPSGVLTTLHSFCAETNCVGGQSPDGAAPFGLIQASDGNFYGVTGTTGLEQVPVPITVFKLTSDGTITTVHSFCTAADCQGWPVVPLIQGNDGNFYGVSCSSTNSAPRGSIFSMTLDGTLTTLYAFQKQDLPSLGGCPLQLMQDTNGKFYGTIELLGPFDQYLTGGTIYRLDIGLAPFIKTVLTQGAVGADVTIMGPDLADATAVTFNGTPAVFKACDSGTAIQTTVPDGATTGLVTVTTPAGTLTSNINFTVLP